MTEQQIKKATNGLPFDRVLHLSLREHELTELNVCVMNQLKSLQSLDISGNKLERMPDNLHLPHLSVLDCSDNKISDLTFLQNFPNLHTLHVEGNLLQLGDLYEATLFCPKLAHINEDPISLFKRKAEMIKKKFEIQVKAKWEVLFAADYLSGIPNNEVSDVCKKFLASLQKDTLFSNATSSLEKTILKELAKEVVTDAKNLKLYNKASAGTPRSARLNEQKISRENTPVVSPDTPLSPSRRSARGWIPKRQFQELNDSPMDTSSPVQTQRTPTRGVKRARESSPELSSLGSVYQKAKVMVMDNRSILSPKFTSIKKKDDHTIHNLPGTSDYDPVHFVRCHSKRNNPEDYSEKVWKCAFEPKPLQPDEHTDIVATCGGKIVCFIDCNTGKVMRRFNDPDKKECFYTLAWTTLPVIHDGKTEHTNILAVGGSSCDVKLIHPSQLVMYAVMEGHARSLFSLTFHPTKPTYLFSGGSDNKIILWDIGIPDFSDYTTDFRKLLILQTPNTEPIHMVVNPNLNVLVAGCQSGCYAWKLGDYSKVSKQPDLDLYIPVLDDDLDSMSSGDSDIIDGLVSMHGDYVVTKAVGQSCLNIWNLKTCIPKNLPRKHMVPVSVTCEAILQYKKTTVDYIAPGASNGLIAIGDDEGCVHLYNVHKLLSNKKKFDCIYRASTVLHWPELSLGTFAESMKDLQDNENIVINTVAVSSNQEYLVCGTDNNLVCIWRKGRQFSAVEQ